MPAISAQKPSRSWGNLPIYRRVLYSLPLSFRHVRDAGRPGLRSLGARIMHPQPASLQTSPAQRSPRYQILDPMRGLAAVWVFLYHYQFSPEFQSHCGWLHPFLKVGDRGVPMFFVISGFCMGLAASRAVANHESIGQFLYRRAKRIYPVFWYAVLLICLLRLMVWFVASHWLPTAQPLPRGFSAYNWIEWLKVVTLTRIFDPKAGVWFGRFGTLNGAFWTLGVEFQFYIVVALTVWRPRWRVWLLGGITLLSLPAYYWVPLFVQCIIYGVFLPFWSWFAFGLGLHSLLAHGVSPGKIFGRGGAAFSLAGIVALLVAFALLVQKNVELERTAFSLGFAVLLWLASDFDGFVGDLLHGKRWIPAGLGKMFLALGAMSYSLYLVHNELAHTIGGAIGAGPRIRGP